MAKLLKNKSKMRIKNERLNEMKIRRERKEKLIKIKRKKNHFEYVIGMNVLVVERHSEY